MTAHSRMSRTLLLEIRNASSFTNSRTKAANVCFTKLNFSPIIKRVPRQRRTQMLMNATEALRVLSSDPCVFRV